MTMIRLLSTLGVVVMSVTLVVGLAAGGFGAEGRAIAELTWGRVTLIDLYVGVSLFGAFVVWREATIWRTLPWLAAFVVLGNLATASYVALAAWRAPSMSEFFGLRDAPTP